jgi:hypothetical protein
MPLLRSLGSCLIRVLLKLAIGIELFAIALFFVYRCFYAIRISETNVVEK